MATARSTLMAVMLVSLLGTAGIALPYPVLSPYFLDPDNANTLTHFLGLPPKILLGILLALYPLGLIVGGSVIGALSDVYGRKPLLTVTMLAATAGYGLTAYAVIIESFPLFALCRFLTGVCQGNIAVSRAIALELHPAINRTRAISLLFATNYAGWLIGPLSGGYLMKLGVAQVFLIAGAVTLAAIVVVQFAIARTTRDAANTDTLWQSMRSQNSLHLLRVREMRPLLIYYFLFTLGLNTFYEFYPLWLVERFAYSSVQIGWSTVAITAAMILSSVYGVTTAEHRFGILGTVRGASLALAGVFLLLPMTGAGSLYVAFVAAGATIALSNGAFPAYMANRFESHGLGRVQGLLTTSFCVASVVAALVGSTVALAGTGWTLAGGGAMVLLASLWLWRWREPAAVNAAPEMPSPQRTQ